MTANGMADNLWDLANIVSGFAIVQSIATAFALSKGDFRFLLRTKSDHIWGIVGTIVFTAFYLVSVFWCWWRAKAIDTNCVDRSIWAWVTSGRIAAIVLFAALVVLTFFGHLRKVRDNLQHSKKSE